MEREKRGERRRERDGDSMRERHRWGSEWVRERGRLFKRERNRERERGGSERERKNRCAKIVCLQ